MSLALESRAMKDDIMLGDTPKARKRRHRVRDVKAAGRLWKHSTLADLDGLVDLPELEKLFIFTLVRNPWDRLVSYYHWLREQSFDHPAVRLAKTARFQDFVVHPQTQVSFGRWPTRAYLTDAAGRARGDAFIRLERFEDDAAPLWAHLGFRLDLPRTNESRRSADWRGYYDDDTAALVGKLCAEDILRFGYRFDP